MATSLAGRLALHGALPSLLRRELRQQGGHQDGLVGSRLVGHASENMVENDGKTGDTWGTNDGFWWKNDGEKKTFFACEKL